MAGMSNHVKEGKQNNKSHMAFDQRVRSSLAVQGVSGRLWYGCTSCVLCLFVAFSAHTSRYDCNASIPKMATIDSQRTS